MTIYSYKGYKDGVYVATIEGSDYQWHLTGKTCLGPRDFGIYYSLQGAKAAWRRSDGPGTRWRAE